MLNKVASRTRLRDNDMFRLEYKGENALGIGSFSDAEMSETLNDVFDKIRMKC